MSPATEKPIRMRPNQQTIPSFCVTRIGTVGSVLLLASLAGSCSNWRNGANSPGGQIAGSATVAESAAHDSGSGPPYDEIAERARATVSDCNLNGMSDRDDIVNDYEDDANLNGVADFCDPDPEFRRLTRDNDMWKQLAGQLDSSYFKVRLRAKEGSNGVLVRYSISVKRDRVTLGVGDLGPSGLDTILVHDRLQAGANELFWDRRFHGRNAPPGVYEFRLEVGSRTYRRRLAWVQ